MKLKKYKRIKLQSYLLKGTFGEEQSQLVGVLMIQIDTETLGLFKV
jgi:hypothetical protein